MENIRHQSKKVSMGMGNLCSYKQQWEECTQSIGIPASGNHQKLAREYKPILYLSSCIEYIAPSSDRLM